MSAEAAVQLPPTRQRFEAMLNALGYRTGMFAIGANGEYVVPVVQHAWELWATNNGLTAIGA